MSFFPPYETNAAYGGGDHSRDLEEPSSMRWNDETELYGEPSLVQGEAASLPGEFGVGPRSVFHDDHQPMVIPMYGGARDMTISLDSDETLLGEQFLSTNDHDSMGVPL